MRFVHVFVRCPYTPFARRPKREGVVRSLDVEQQNIFATLLHDILLRWRYFYLLLI